MNTEPSIASSKVTQFSRWSTILLHLLPGALIAAVYSLLVKTVSASGYPKVISISLAAIIVLLPFELGYILYRSKKELGTFSLWKMIPYREKVSLKDYIILVPLLFIWFGLMFTITKSLNSVLLNKVFYWLPHWYFLSEVSPPGAS
jgi:chromate transport protein ChrA